MDVLCLDFFLSDWRDFRGRFIRECLEEPDWLSAFLERWNLSPVQPATPEIVEALKQLRATMRHIVEALPDKQPADEDLHFLNAVIHKGATIPSLVWDGQRYQMQHTPPQKDWDWVIAEIAASFADLLVKHDLQRIKICANPYCCSIFYDDTKSRTKRWCTNEKCGNLWKLRRFRERHKDDNEPDK